VCDRVNNRIQVFRKDGTFVKEFIVAPDTRGNGSTWDADLSHDAAQTFLYNVDGENNHVWTLLRDSGRILGVFGRSGRQAGQFHRVHNMAVDSKGNIHDRSRQRQARPEVRGAVSVVLIDSLGLTIPPVPPAVGESVAKGSAAPASSNPIRLMVTGGRDLSQRPLDEKTRAGREPALRLSAQFRSA
jgi:hypothetical protein